MKFKKYIIKKKNYNFFAMTNGRNIGKQQLIKKSWNKRGESIM